MLCALHLQILRCSAPDGQSSSVYATNITVRCTWNNVDAIKPADYLSNQYQYRQLNTIWLSEIMDAFQAAAPRNLCRCSAPH